MCSSHLNPGHKLLYTWESPSGPRVLVWDIGRKRELSDDLRKDGVGEFSPADDYHVYWVSFLDGMQRVLLFTMNKTIAENVQSAKQFEAIQQEITVSIHGLGLSLVDNVSREEIMYVGITSSGIIWEACKTQSKRLVTFNINTYPKLSFCHHSEELLVPKCGFQALIGTGKMVM